MRGKRSIFQHVSCFVIVARRWRDVHRQDDSAVAVEGVPEEMSDLALSVRDYSKGHRLLGLIFGLLLIPSEGFEASAQGHQ